MVARGSVIVFLLCILSLVYGQPAVYFTSDAVNVIVGKALHGDVALNYVPSGDVTVEIVANANYTFTPNVFRFNSTVTELEYNLVFNAVTEITGNTLNVVVSEAADVYNPTISSLHRTLFFPDAAATVNVVAGNYGAPRELSLDTVTPTSVAGQNVVVTFTPSSPDVVVSPSSITFDPTEPGSADKFYNLLYKVNVASDTLTYTILITFSGYHAEWYTTTLKDIFGDVDNKLKITSSPRQFKAPVGGILDASILAKQQSKLFVFSVNDLPPSDVTITPHAENTTFTPSAFTFTPSVGKVFFSYSISWPTAPSTLPVYFVVSGTNANMYNNVLANQTIRAVGASCQIVYPTTQTNFFVTQTSKPVFINLNIPPTSPLTVTITDTDHPTAVYNPSTLTFAAGEMIKSFTVSSAVPSNINPQLKLSGGEAAQYAVSTLNPLNRPVFNPSNLIVSTHVSNSDTKCGEAVTVTMQLDFPASQAFSVEVSSKLSSVSASNINFAVGDLTHTFTAVSVAEGAAVSFALLGSPYVQLSDVTLALPSSFKTIQVYPKQGVVFPGDTIAYEVTVSALPSAGRTLVFTPSVLGITFTPSSITFSSTSASVQTFSVVVPLSPYRSSILPQFTLTGDSCFSPNVLFTNAVIGKASLTALGPINPSPYGYEYNVPLKVNGINGDISLTYAAFDSNGLPYPANIITPQPLVFNAQTANLNFKFTLPTVTDSSEITFRVVAVSGSQVEMTTGPTTTSFVVPQPSPIRVHVPLFTYGSYYVGVASPAQQVLLSAPAVTPFSVRPTSTSLTPARVGEVSFSPISFVAGDVSKTFTFTNNAYHTDTQNIDYQLVGDNTEIYELVVGTTPRITFSKYVVTVSGNGGNTMVRVGDSFNFNVYASQLASPVSIRLSDSLGRIVFNPSVVTLSPTALSIPVQATVVTGLATDVGTTFTSVSAEVVGVSPLIQVAGSFVVSIEKRQISVRSYSGSPTLLAGQNSPNIYLRSDDAIVSDVTISMFVTGGIVTPSQVTLTPANPIASYTFQLLPNADYSIVVVEYIINGEAYAVYNPIDTSVFQFSSIDPSNLLRVSSNVVEYPGALVGASQLINLVVDDDRFTEGEIIVTPYSPNSKIVFTPATVTLTTSNQEVSIVATSQGFSLGLVSVQLMLSGTSSSLFYPKASAVLQFNKPLVSVSFPAGRQTTIVDTPLIFTVDIQEAPTTDLTVTLQSSSSAVVFTPATLTFSSSSGTTQSVSIVGSKAENVRIGVMPSGASASDYSLSGESIITIAKGVVGRYAASSASFYASGHEQTISYSLDVPVKTDLTITLVSDKLSFNPPSVTLAAGQVYFEVNAKAIASGTAVVNTLLTGTDANRYSTVGTFYTNVGALLVRVSQIDQFFVDTKLSVSVASSLSDAIPSFDFGSLEVTPVASGVVFTPSTFTLSSASPVVIISASATSFFATPPVATLLFGGNAAGLFTSNGFDISFPSSPFGLNVQTPGSDKRVVSTAFVGDRVPGTIQLFPGNPRSTISTTIPSVTITLSSNNPGVFEPATLTLEGGATVGMFTFIPSTLASDTVVYYTLSGPGARFFVRTGDFYLIGTTSKRSFTVTTPTYEDLEGNKVAMPFGIASPNFYISAGAANFDVTITPISENFQFTPSSVHFGKGTSALTFTATPVKLGYAVDILFAISGPDASLFAPIAASRTFNIAPSINVTSIPVLTLNKLSDNVDVTLSPAPLSTISIKPRCGNGDCTFVPPVLVFSPDVPKVSFQIISRTTSLQSSHSYTTIPGTQFGPTGGEGDYIVFDAVQSSVGGNTFAFATDPTFIRSVPVVTAPNTFAVKHPRYQMDVTSKIEVKVSSAPRSDVSVTMYGNNMEFNPPYVTFTANGPTKQTIKVTPKFSSSYELDYASSKINYVCSGSSQSDFLCPGETHHFVAISRGYVAAAVLLPLVVVAAIVVLVFFFVVRRSPSSSSRSKNSASSADIELK